MPTYTKLKSGSWRVRVRRKRQYVANTFVRRRDAEEWAIDAERFLASSRVRRDFGASYKFVVLQGIQQTLLL